MNGRIPHYSAPTGLMIPEPDFTGYTMVRDSCLFINYLATAKVQKFFVAPKEKCILDQK